MRFEIHPSVGVARLGNSPDGFYLEPETTGGRPVECTPLGDPILAGGRPVPVEKFKDASGRIRRHGSRFRVYVYDAASPNGREIVISARTSNPSNGPFIWRTRKPFGTASRNWWVT